MERRMKLLCVWIMENDMIDRYITEKLTKPCVLWLTIPLALLAPVNTDSAIHLFALSSDANLTKAVPLGRSVALSITNLANNTLPKFSSIISFRSCSSELKLRFRTKTVLFSLTSWPFLGQFFFLKSSSDSPNFLSGFASFSSSLSSSEPLSQSGSRN